MSEIITDLPEDFLREFAEEVLGTIPEEKAKAELRQAEIGRVLAAEGSLRTAAGLGQKLGTVDARTYFRFAQEFPGCWQDDSFVQEFFRDNPQLRAPGWTPKASGTRHGLTFVGGKPVTAPKVA